MNYFMLTLLVADPREFSISTKEFVVDADQKLVGLNTGALRRFRSFTSLPYANVTANSPGRVD
jgi:hypothetical protein